MSFSHEKRDSASANKTGLLIALLCILTIAIGTSVRVTAKTISSADKQPATSSTVQTTPRLMRPRIQMAILLDTSNSMDGLIDQTRNQLWTVVNEFSSAKRQGLTPILEVALFEYGNDSNSMNDGYVRRLNGFTRELDQISESLFALQTNGGSEFCGFAIQTAVQDLQWSQSDNDIKTIFIAGNEEFSQGPVEYQAAISQAKKRGISVNTIFAGDFQSGSNSGWQSGALLAGGDYMSIDADRKVVHIDAPQDKQISDLNNRLNQTYLPYGASGAVSLERQAKQDEQSESISIGLLAKRVRSKSSSFYNNSSWDLVDAIEDGKLTDAELSKLEADDLPPAMKSMTTKQRKDYVVQQAETRKQLKKQIADLGLARELYVAQEKKKAAEGAPSVSDAVSTAVRKQASEKGFEFENTISSN